MHLLPSLRQKKRYVVIEVISEQSFLFPDVHEAVEEGLQWWWGELGQAQASPLFLPETFDFRTQRCIIKVNHAWVDPFKAGLLFIKSIKKKPVILRTITVSGTLKKARLRGGL